MRRGILLATILLLFQLGLILAVNMQGGGYEHHSPSDRLAVFEPESVDAIHLVDKEKGDLLLRKKDGAWFIATSQDLLIPADSELTKGFIEKIAGFKKGLAVATSKDAAERFEVHPDKFAYRLEILKQKEKLAVLYFGTSAGFKQIHARIDGSDEIITVGLGGHELAASAEQWIDKNMLKLKEDSLQRIEFDKFVLERQDDNKWQERDLGGGGKLSDEDVQKLVGAVSNFSVHDYAAKDVPAEDQTGTADLEFTMVKKDNTTLDWHIAKDGDNSYVIKRSDRDYPLKVSGWQIEDLQKIIAGEKTEKAGGESAEVSPDGPQQYSAGDGSMN